MSLRYNKKHRMWHAVFFVRYMVDLHFLEQEYFCGEVVGVAVEPYAARVGAQRVALTGSLVVFEEVEVINLTFPEVKSVGVIMLEHVA